MIDKSYLKTVGGIKALNKIGHSELDVEILYT
jgi:hypothetical protein